MSLGWKVWEAIEKEYKIEDSLPIDILELYQYDINAKSLNSILSGFTNSVFVEFI